MRALWDAIIRGYLRLVDPIADYLARKGVSPNEITTLGTFCSVAAGTMFAMGHVRTAGWVLGLTAVFDVLDGQVARRTGRETVFGAFYDSTLDRLGRRRCWAACSCSTRATRCTTTSRWWSLDSSASSAHF